MKPRAAISIPKSSPPPAASDDGFAAAVRAKVKLRKAIDVLVTAQPFHAEVMSAWTARPDPQVGTCGVFFEHGSLQMRYAPAWLDTLTVGEICGVLVHECLHVLFGHVHIVPDDTIDGRALLIATETTVNEFVPYPLPGEPLLLEQFPELAPLQSTWMRYERLRRPPVPCSSGSGSGEPHEATAAVSSPPSGFDTHAGWQSIRAAGPVATLAISVAKDRAVRRFGHLLDPAARKALCAEIGVGSEAGDGVERVRSTAAAWLDWRMILAHLPPLRERIEPTLSRPPRRRPGLMGIVPGRRRVSQPPILLVAVDVSSSMSTVILTWIKQEVRVLASLYRVALIEIDIAVTRALLLFDGEEHRPGLVDDNAHGRGGTAFDAAFTPEVLAWAGGQEEVDAVVYFTDGFAPAPAARPAVPTIWVLADEHDRTRVPAPWGTVIGTDGTIVRAD